MKKIKFHRQVILALLSLAFLGLAFSRLGEGDLLSSLHLFPGQSILIALASLAANIFLTTYRFKEILAIIGCEIPYPACYIANIRGHIASLFFVSLLGQPAGRQTEISKFGVSPTQTTFATAIEKVLLLLVSGILFLVASVKLSIGDKINNFLADSSVYECVIVAILCIAVSSCISTLRHELWRLYKKINAYFIRRSLKLIVLTLSCQLLILMAYTALAYDASSGIPIEKILIASAITSFAASLPISINGWGVRELAAIYSFGAIGVSEPKALSVSISIGILSTLVILLAGSAMIPLQAKKMNKKGECVEYLASFQPSGIKYSENLGALIGGTFGTVLVCFQLHLDLPQGVINLNLADPIALLSFATVILLLAEKRRLQVWNIRRMNLFLGLITTILVIGFIRGAWLIGITQWAFTGRLIGWLVLVGYMCIGICARTYLGRIGTKIISETFISTAICVGVYRFAERFLASIDILPFDPSIRHFEGFSQNRNAFAFLLLCGLIILISLLKTTKQNMGLLRPRLSIGSFHVNGAVLCFSFLSFFLILTGSKAGMITYALLISCLLVSNIIEKNLVLKGMILTLVLWLLLVNVAPAFILAVMNFVASLFNGPQGLDEFAHIGPIFSGTFSTQERIMSIAHGFELWKNSPLFGAGLGVAIYSSVEKFGYPLVIHSTPIWILAEFGLFGFAGFMFAVFSLLKKLPRHEFGQYSHQLLGLLFIVFIAFSLVHEIFAQRVFWLALGIILTLPNRNELNQPESEAIGEQTC